MSSLQSRFQRLLESRSEPGAVAPAPASTTDTWEEAQRRRERERALARLTRSDRPSMAGRATAGVAEWYPGARRIEATAEIEGGYAHVRTRVPVEASAALAAPARELLHCPGPPIPPEIAALDLAAAYTLCGCNPRAAAPLDRLLFYDIETTGLAGGAGTYAFLIGAGYFEAGDFVVEQFLLEDFCDEPALLADLARLMGRFEALVTYNGRTFDLPVTTTRYVLNGARPALLRAPNLDLLPPARRLWRAAAGGASLGRIEQFVLGFGRADDVPGELIPLIFHDYARGWRRERMGDVLRHNLQDIVSMAGLLDAAVRRFVAGDRIERGAASAECLGLAGVLRRHGRPAEARRLLDEACARAEAPHQTERCRRLLALAHRAERRFDKADDFWSQLAAMGGPRHAEYAIERAKHLEHRCRDHAGALDLVRSAAARLERAATHTADSSTDDASLPATDAERRRWASDLERRRERLERRLRADAHSDVPAPTSEV